MIKKYFFFAVVNRIVLMNRRICSSKLSALDIWLCLLIQKRWKCSCVFQLCSLVLSNHVFFSAENLTCYVLLEFVLNLSVKRYFRFTRQALVGHTVKMMQSTFPSKS